MGFSLQALMRSMMGSPYGVPQIDYIGLFTGLVLIIIGLGIASPGPIATFLKYSAEYYARGIHSILFRLPHLRRNSDSWNLIQRAGRAVKAAEPGKW